MNLEHPAWLWVLLVVPVIAIGAVLFGRFTSRPWENFAAERLRGRLIKRDHPLPRWLSLGLLLAAIAALAMALSRPQGDAGVKTETTTGRNVMIALDLSRSMKVQDVKPDRLTQAKIVIYELLESLESDRIGLVGFAGTPYLFAPLTIDHAAVRETVEQIDGDWVSSGGSDIASAIRLATETLKETGQKNNALIVISDGEEHEGDLDAIVADAESAGVMIFAIGVGTEDGGFIPHPGFSGGMVDREGRPILSTLQPDVMRKLAKDTGGTYVIAGRGADIPSMVEVAIQGMETFEIEGGQTRVVIEFYQWVLLPAIFFLMAAIVAGTRWRGIVGGAATALVFLLSGQNAKADRAKDARSAFSEERFDDARDTYRSLADDKVDRETAAKFRLGEGLSAYEAQDYRGARKAYSAAILAEDPLIVGEAHEGLANTLFQLGWMGLSGSRYPADEGLPDMEQFDKLVRDQLQAMSEAEVPSSGETNEFIRLDSIILNWFDAVRHYQSALANNPKDMGARKNAELTVKYLQRMQELLRDEKESAEQEMPQQGQGEPGLEGVEGEASEEGEGGEENGEPEEGPGDQDKSEQDTGEEEGGDDEGKGDESDKESENDGDADPNESEEDRARRLLQENQDLEKGSLAPGRREIRDPEKDY